jgi:hypothetical protein
VRDFTQVFDAYAQFEELSLNKRMEEIAENDTPSEEGMWKSGKKRKREKKGGSYPDGIMFVLGTVGSLLSCCLHLFLNLIDYFVFSPR